MVARERNMIAERSQRWQAAVSGSYREFTQDAKSKLFVDIVLCNSSQNGHSHDTSFCMPVSMKESSTNLVVCVNSLV